MNDHDRQFFSHLEEVLSQTEADGLLKSERKITSAQGGSILVARNNDQSEVLNLCANNYLGLAAHPKLVRSAVDCPEEHGHGMVSVRFICGTIFFYLLSNFFSSSKILFLISWFC